MGRRAVNGFRSNTRSRRVVRWLAVIIRIDRSNVCLMAHFVAPPTDRLWPELGHTGRLNLAEVRGNNPRSAPIRLSSELLMQSSWCLARGASDLVRLQDLGHAREKLRVSDTVRRLVALSPSPAHEGLARRAKYEVL